MTRATLLRPAPALLVALAFALAACGSGPPEPPAPAPARPAPPPEPEPAEDTEPADADGEVEGEDEGERDDDFDEFEDAEPEYVYSPIGKRDPFRSPFQDMVIAATDAQRTERLTRLQRWDLDQLVLRAVITATADPVGMVIDPEGEGHFVRRGTLMGRNWGRVTAVRRECIVVTEQMRDATGTPMAVQQERCLPQDERERRFEEQMRQQIQ